MVIVIIAHKNHNKKKNKMHSKERNIVTRGYNEYYDKLKYAFRKKHDTV